MGDERVDVGMGESGDQEQNQMTTDWKDLWRHCLKRVGEQGLFGWGSPVCMSTRVSSPVGVHSGQKPTSVCLPQSVLNHFIKLFKNITLFTWCMYICMCVLV